MNEPEPGFLVVESTDGRLSGRTEFRTEEADAESTAKAWLRPTVPQMRFPFVYVIPVKRFTTKETLDARPGEAR